MNEVSRSVETIAAEIKVFEKSLKESVARHAWEIGKRLNEAKEVVPRGEFTSWLESNFEFTDRYAQEFMKFNALNPNLNSVFDSLEWSKIRQVMSLPESIDRSEFLEQEHVVPSTGESKAVGDMTVKELREVKKALQAAEQRAKQAEAARQLSIKQHSEQQDKLLVQIEELRKSKAADSPATLKRIADLERLLQKAEKRIEEYRLRDTSNFDEQEAGKQRAKLQHEADVKTIDLRVAYKRFIEGAAISTLLHGAIGASSQSEKKHLSDLVEMAEKIIRDTKTALSGRRELNSYE